MLDARLIRNEPERVKEGARAKNENRADVDRWLLLDARRREIIDRVETLKAERNQATKEIGQRRQAGEETAGAQTRTRELGEEIGSGYPADPITVEFMKKWISEKGGLPPYTRRSWETARRMLAESKVKKLDEFQ